MRFYTYVHLKETTGEPFYVGKGKDDRAYEKRGRNRYWRNVVAKHGHTVQILRECDSEDEAFAYEVSLIAQYRSMGYPLVNMTDGGDGLRNPSPETRARISEALKGHRPTPEARARNSEAQKKASARPETRARRSEASKGRSPWIKGRSHTPETRARISEAHNGRSLSPETRAKLSEAHKGRSHTPEARARMREAMSGRIWINNGTVTKMIKPNEPLPEGFVLGRLKPASLTRAA